MPKYKVWSFLAALVLARPAFSEDPLLAEVRTEVKKSVEQIEAELLLPLKSRTAGTSTSTNPAVPSGSYEYIAYTSGSDFIIWSERPEPKGRDPMSDTAVTLYARNPRYSFKITQAPNSNTWLLANIAKAGDPDAAKLDELLAKYSTDIVHAADAMRAIDGVMKISSLFDAEGFKLISSARSGPSGKIVIKCTRNYRGASGQQIDCEYTFDPANYWLPVEWFESFSSPSVTRTSRVSQKYLVGQHKYEIESTRVETTNRPDTRSTTRKTMFTVETDVAFEEAKFSLPAYGLPEPPGFEAPKTPLYVWLLAVAVGCLCLTFGLRLFLRRRSGSIPPSPTL